MFKGVVLEFALALTFAVIFSIFKCFIFCVALYFFCALISKHLFTSYFFMSLVISCFFDFFRLPNEVDYC